MQECRLKALQSVLKKYVRIVFLVHYDNTFKRDKPEKLVPWMMQMAATIYGSLRGCLATVPMGNLHR